MKDDTVKFVLSQIEKEYETYKAEWVAKGADAVWENSFRINARCCIKDFLLDGELPENKINSLYVKCNGQVISTLVDEYIDSEYYDIAQYSDLKDLVENFLRRE